MTDDEITDVSAWLMAQRPLNPGQPYPNVNAKAETAARAASTADEAMNEEGAEQEQLMDEKLPPPGADEQTRAPGNRNVSRDERS